jgi:pimeloyl-ACP methyl ester carboxylesterase
VVTFDRPGFGLSPDADGPRTPTAIAHELREVLSELGVSGPVVLVGHSMGGVHALRYADLYPEDVAGVVLLDTPPPGFEEERLELLTAREREERRRALAAGRSSAPPMVGRERDGAAAEPWVFDHYPEERPLLVVVADDQNFGDLGSAAAHRDLWMRRSSRWLSLSSNSELVVARGSGHMVHHDRSQFVLDLILRLIDRVN